MLIKMPAHKSYLFSTIIDKINHCRWAAGHFYGYVRGKNNEKSFDDDVLSNEYLICSDQIGFSINYLWDLVLQSLFSNACFESMANVYNNLHFSNLLPMVKPRSMMSFGVLVAGQPWFAVASSYHCSAARFNFVAVIPSNTLGAAGAGAAAELAGVRASVANRRAATFIVAAYP